MANYFKNIWTGLYTVLVGMKITWKHLFVKNVTIQYPNVNPLEKAGGDKMPEIARNRLKLEADHCNGCTSCSRACPVKCITIETVKVVPEDQEQPLLADGTKRKLWLAKYNIDFAKCCFCGLCTTVCPTGAIRMTTEFEYSTYNRDELLYKFSIMSDAQIAEKKKLLAESMAKAKAKAAEDAAKAAEAAKPDAAKA